VTLGLRAERQRVATAHAGTVDLGTTLDPRLGAAFDVYGDGTWKLYGLLARGRAPVDPALFLPAVPALRVDPAAVAPAVLEAALGSEQLVVAGVVLSARAGYWRGSDPLLRLWRFDPGAPVVEVANPSRRLASGRDREVELLQLALSARLALGEDWELGGGYSFTQVDGALDLQLLGEGAACGLATVCLAASGVGFPSAIERPHRLVLHGSQRFAPGVWGAFVYAASEGTPFVPLLEIPVPGHDATRPVADRGAAGADARNDASAQLDLSAGWDVPLGDRPYRVALEISAFNVFDERKVLERWPYLASTAPAFGEPVLVQEGRWLRFDVRLEF
jgi:hypothetical protein